MRGCADKAKRMVPEPASIFDIMYNVSVACDSNTFDRMKQAATALIKQTCADRYGYVDEERLAELMFSEHSPVSRCYSIFDEGHLRMLGYIIGHYLSASNQHLKAFLAKMHTEYEHAALSGACMRPFGDVLNNTFNLIIVNHASSGKLSFRKRHGRCTSL